MHIPLVPPLPLHPPAAVGRIGAIGRPTAVLPTGPSGGPIRRRGWRATLAVALSALLRPLAARSVSG
jgi:hypothetical protein